MIRGHALGGVSIGADGVQVEGLILVKSGVAHGASPEKRTAEKHFARRGRIPRVGGWSERCG